MNTATKVYVVDDEPAVLRALTRLLASAGFEACGVQSPREFIEHHLAAEVGCVVMDYSMPEIDGLELQRTVGRSEHACPVIFVSGHGDIATSVDAMKAGAVDFLTKPVDADSLFAAVSAALTRCDRARCERQALDDLRCRFDALTVREKQVFQGVVEGLLNKQIAERLGTAEKTIKVQRGQVMRKMAAHSLADLVRMATRLFH